jgi:hypothetical protein
MRIMRCELCEKPCMLTVLSDKSLQYCPATGKPAQWRQVNISKSRHPAKA